jgi:hypothetical protein
VLTDWSSIFTGFGIVWGCLVLYGISVFVRTWRLASGDENR